MAASLALAPLVYRRREPERTALYRGVQRHLDSFVSPESSERSVPSFVMDEFNDDGPATRENEAVPVTCSPRVDEARAKRTPTKQDVHVVARFSTGRVQPLSLLLSRIPAPGRVGFSGSA